MKIFSLPDLGEGLPDAEIIKWHVSEGDDIKLDEPLISMETAKAVVEVPSPFTGKLSKQFGSPGDVIETGRPLAGFDIEGEVAEADGVPGATETTEDEAAELHADSGTVVGTMKTSNRIVSEPITDIGGVRVTPAVRALARKLKVNIADVVPTGKDGVVTRADIEKAASNPQLSIKTAHPDATAVELPAVEWEPVRGTRRTMARVMSDSHAQVVPTSIMDDADIHPWQDDQDLTVRLLRSMWAGAVAEPGLNAWYDPGKNARVLHRGMDVGMAVDTEDGLFVAALRNVHTGSTEDIRRSIRRLRENIENRSIPPADLKNYTIMLSNFGMIAGRYATPVIVPPCVSIVAAGKSRDEVVPALGSFEIHRKIPISLTFDHRACTGGEAARFLKAMLDDLALPE